MHQSYYLIGSYFMFLREIFGTFLLSLVLPFFLPREIRRQKLILDSSQLNFENDVPNDYSISHQNWHSFDFRDVPHSRLIGIDEVTQYVFVTVNLHLLSSRPFADVVEIHCLMPQQVLKTIYLLASIILMSQIERVFCLSFIKLSPWSDFITDPLPIR